MGRPQSSHFDWMGGTLKSQPEFAEGSFGGVQKQPLCAPHLHNSFISPAKSNKSANFQQTELACRRAGFSFSVRTTHACQRRVFLRTQTFHSDLSYARTAEGIGATLARPKLQRPCRPPGAVTVSCIYARCVCSLASSSAGGTLRPEEVFLDENRNVVVCAGH